MTRFFGRYTEIVEMKRREIAAEIASIYSDGIEGEAAATVGERLLPALRTVYENGPGGAAPACFAALLRAVLENSGSSADRTAAVQSLTRVDAEIAAFLKARYPSVEILDLGSDDLRLVVSEAARLQAKVRKELVELRGEGGGRTTFLDRVRTRLSRAEAERLSTEEKDLNPQAVSSYKSVSRMLLGAADRRQNFAPDPVEPGSRSEDVAVPSEVTLLKAAAMLSKYMPNKDQARLRAMIRKSGRDVTLSVDDEEDEGLNFAWMGAAR